MNIFKKIFQATKGKTFEDDQKSNGETITVKSNPAFEYVQDKYGIDCNIYRKLSLVIHSNSVAAANEFAEIIREKSNEDLVHFFFDYFLCQYVAHKSEYFHTNNNDAYSAIIDGMHIDFYGNVSNEVIESIMQLWTTQNKCFLKTDIASFKNKEVGDSIRLMINIASHCAGKTMIGATEGVKWSKLFLLIARSKLSSIDTFFQNKQL